MDLETLKNSLELGEQFNQLFIFVYQDNKFVAEQYVKQMAVNNRCEIEHVETVADLLDSLGDMFGSDSIKVLITDKLEVSDPLLRKVKGAVIITNKIEKNTEKLFSDFVVKIPKLEQWQIEDYIITRVPGVREDDLRSLVVACDCDIYKVDSELSKLSVFKQDVRQSMFQLCTENGCFPTTEKYTIFSLSNALLTKNITETGKILAHIEDLDINPIALLSILYKNVANVITIQLDKSATPESTGMSNGQFYAIKKNNVNFYTAEQLRAIFKFLTALDLKIKSGELSMNVVIPYIVTYMLGVK